MGRAFEVRKKSMMQTSASKSKLYARYGKEIYVAAKNGVPDPSMNQVLKQVIEKAKREQIPADVIKRAVEKATGSGGENYQNVRYEIFGPASSLLIVECLTDNPNRSISDLRAAFNKTEGKLGVSGSVMHFFEHLAVFSFKGLDEETVMESLLEKDCDFDDIESEEDIVTVYASPSSFNKIRQALSEIKADLEILAEEITFLPLDSIKITSEADYKLFEKLLTLIEDCDDVQNVYHNVILN